MQSETNVAMIDLSPEKENRMGMRDLRKENEKIGFEF